MKGQTMTKHLAASLTLFPLLLAACEPSQPQQASTSAAAPTIESSEKHLTSESVPYVPPSFDPQTIAYDFVLHNYTLFASHNLVVKERAKLYGVIGANNYVEIRDGSLVTGHVTSRADARMIQQSKIEGDATIGATALTKDAASVITGTTKTGMAIPEVPLSDYIPSNPRYTTPSFGLTSRSSSASAGTSCTPATMRSREPRARSLGCSPCLRGLTART
jgi:hypothetical protein